MATLEVHNGRGRVDRVTIASDQPVMLGSSPKCDVVLGGEGVLAFHGRLRWQPRKGRFKLDASPEAEYLLVNGQKMASSRFGQGDEVQIGENRIFMIHDAGPEPRPAPVRDDKTRVQPAPFMPPPQAGEVLRREAWRQWNEVAPPSAEIPAAASEPEGPGGRGRRAGPAVAAPDPDGVRAEPQRGWGRLFYLFSARAYAPGQERVLSSPLAFGLAATLAALILVGFVLYGIIARTAADRLYDLAVVNLEDGEYRNAARRFEEFVRANPDDRRAGKARVHKAMAEVRQYTSTAGANGSLALEAEKAMFESVGREEAYRDSSTELGELVVKTGEGLADRAKASADAKTLAEAEEAVALHAKVAGKAAGALLKASKLPEKLAAARASVVKQRVRREALAAMDAALAAGSSAGVYAARDALVAEYAEQSEDRELLGRMTRANGLILKAVGVDPSGRPGETEPHPDPLGPLTSLVLRGQERGSAARGGPLVFALADGFAYAVEGETGDPVWQVSVGLSSPFPPQPVAGVPAVLAVDARHDELVRLDARTGALVWRQGLGGPVDDPPLVLGNQLFQSTPAGKILVIDLPTGALRATVDLGMPLARAPVSDESGQVLYVAAERDCLFVLNRDPLGCAAVEYLGQGPGAVACPPARLGRYLVVPENHRIGEGRWRVFLLDEQGTRLSEVQQVPIPGWTWESPASSGSVMWSSADRNGVTAFAVGAYGEKDPFRMIAKVNADPQPSGPSYALARSGRELLVGSGRSGRYELDAEGGKLAAVWTLGEAGPALAPPQTAGSRLVLTQQHNDGPGVALWGVDPPSGRVVWRAVLGARWPTPPEPSGDGRGLNSLGADGRTINVSRDVLAAGGFVESPLPRPGSLKLPPEAFARVEGEGWTAVVPSRNAEKLFAKAGKGEFKEVGLPAAVAAKPLAWGKDLLVPGDDGRAYLIDPLKGEPRAEPFVPPFDRTRPTRWTAPVLVGDDAVVLADEGGVVRRLVRVADPRPRLVVAAETALGSTLIGGPAATGGAVVVATADGRVRSLSPRDLSPVGSWTMDAPLATPPAGVGGRGYVVDKAGNVLALAADGQKLWSAKLGDDDGRPTDPAGPPAVLGQSVWFLSRDGVLRGLSLADGSAVARSDLNAFPAGGPVALGDVLAVPVGLGTYRLWKNDGPKAR